MKCVIWKKLLEIQDDSHLNLEYTKDVMDIMSQLRKEWKMQYPGENGKEQILSFCNSIA